MKKAVLAFAVAGCLYSCKKSDVIELDNCNSNIANITGTYHISSIKYKTSASAVETDLFSNLPDCEKDDTFRLDADGTFVATDAGVSCGLLHDPDYQNSWMLYNNNTVLKIENVYFNIESFNCTKLVVSISDVSKPGDKRTICYVKQ